VTPLEPEGEVEEQTAPPPPPDADAEESLDLSHEAVIADLERVTTERDEYLDSLRRTQADFENYRKRAMKQQADQAEGVAARLVEDLLPVLDACDGAIRHGAAEVEPVFATLLGTLEKGGLERIDPIGEPFDPNRHEAVMHEPAADGDEGTLVTDVMRAGYSWKGRVLRAAMVKVRG
jgi:molecular chaperone GrpE